MSPSYHAFTAFVCKTAFEHDARDARDGTLIYPSEAAARAALKCVHECGLVEVSVTLRRVVQEADFSAYRSEGGETP